MSNRRRRAAFAAMISPVALRGGRLGRVLGPTLDLSLAEGCKHGIRALGAERRAEANDDDSSPEVYRPIWEHAASTVGAQVSDLGSGFLLIARDARETVVWRNLVALDNPVTLRLCADKPAIHRLLSSAGLPTPQFATFDRRDISNALRLMGEQPGPWVVKPAFGTGRGRGVTCGVHTPGELRRAAVWASRWASRMLIEDQGCGSEYRALVLDGEVLDVIRRRPPRVAGDGRHTVAQLIDAENSRRAKSDGALGLFPISVNLDCLLALRNAGMTLESVPASKVEVAVKQTANENGAQDNESVIDAVGAAFRSAMRDAAQAIGVRLASFELIGPEPNDCLSVSDAIIVEINTTPGLHYHYHVANAERSVRVAVPVLRTLLGIT